ncbi:MAG: c-type cytochrome domain-containing protein [Dehalococcoidia bacterium]|nr:c-type cytochrome domain-containing protein [Dehalococcoidia bacterium]
MKQTILAIAVAGALAFLVLACTPRAPAAPTSSQPPVTGEVQLRVEARWTGSYSRDIQPIFDPYCTRCHGSNLAENGLRLDSYEGVMKGTQFGPVVTPGAPGASSLVYVIQGISSEKIRMPHQEPRLTVNRIQNIIYWIEAGARKD